ncbi:MAG TPA: methionine ABC transporter permease [Tissierellaceae bacterium]|nr:methionine ABC transporter permease [Tissierellaceae bacterium]
MADLILTATWETLYMVILSVFFALIVGLPLGVLLFITEKDNIWEKPMFNNILGGVINILRSIPFIILMILLFPLTKIIVGRKIGITATIVPLSISAAPFLARVTESSIREIDKGVIESSLAMGASVFEIIKMVLIPESLPSIISGITLTIINLIGYSAMAGAIGAGGLGDLAIRFGLYRYDLPIMLLSLVVIIILVQGIQYIGTNLALKIDKR